MQTQTDTHTHTQLWNPAKYWKLKNHPNLLCCLGAREVCVWRRGRGAAAVWIPVGPWGSSRDQGSVGRHAEHAYLAYFTRELKGMLPSTWCGARHPPPVRIVAAGSPAPHPNVFSVWIDKTYDEWEGKQRGETPCQRLRSKLWIQLEESPRLLNPISSISAVRSSTSTVMLLAPCPSPNGAVCSTGAREQLGLSAPIPGSSPSPAACYMQGNAVQQQPHVQGCAPQLTGAKHSHRRVLVRLLCSSLCIGACSSCCPPPVHLPALLSSILAGMWQHGGDAQEGIVVLKLCAPPWPCQPSQRLSSGQLIDTHFCRI